MKLLFKEILVPLILFAGCLSFLVGESETLKPSSMVYPSLLKEVKSFEIIPLRKDHWNKISESVIRPTASKLDKSDPGFELIDIIKQKKRFEVLAVLGEKDAYLIKDKISNKVIRIPKGETVQVDSFQFNWSEGGELQFLDNSGKNPPAPINNFDHANPTYEAIIKNPNDPEKSYQKGESIPSTNGNYQLISISKDSISLQKGESVITLINPKIVD